MDNYKTEKQAERLEQNVEIARRYKDLRSQGVTAWRAVEMISTEEVSVRRINMSSNQIRRILISMEQY